jgi:hypothetical protein
VRQLWSPSRCVMTVTWLAHSNLYDFQLASVDGRGTTAVPPDVHAVDQPTVSRACREKPWRRFSNPMSKSYANTMDTVNHYSDILLYYFSPIRSNTAYQSQQDGALVKQILECTDAQKGSSGSQTSGRPKFDPCAGPKSKLIVASPVRCQDQKLINVKVLRIVR